MAKYNGHKNFNHWNVSLWINNDEGLYNMALNFIKESKRQGMNRDNAAEAMFRDMEELGYNETPDGAPYSVTTIRAAMRGM